MINIINFSMLKSPYTYDHNDMDNGDSKSRVSEPTIKHSMILNK